MNLAFLSPLLEHYEWRLSLATLVLIYATSFVAGKLLQMSPTIRDAVHTNKAAYQKKMEIARYRANQKMNMSWGLLFMVVIFGAILPFCLTLQAPPWWRIPVDVVVILLVYDFVYYFAHRFLFHDNGFLGGPLVWMHAVHHQQHNPCRGDSSYIHPLEVAIGLGLYVGTIFFLSRLMGEFSIVSIVITWIAFQVINVHNHALWSADRFPFRYMNYLSVMHHHHHAKFTGGNYATISLLYDWMFGTLDNGQGYKKPAKTPSQSS